MRRALIAAGGAVAIAAALAPAAHAGFSLASCTGEGVLGRGSSFQNAAINNAFKPLYQSAIANGGCGPDAGVVNYDPAGSGNGRAALGEKNATLNPNQDRDPSVRFAGTDQAPNSTQRQQIENGPIDANGQDVTSADNDKVHVIPIAIGAIAIAVHLPTGCDYSGTAKTADRPTLTDATLEGIFAGTVTTWGQAIAGLTPAACANAAITRVVRRDSSGTSFALKQFLADINPGRNWGALGNTVWPSGAGTSPLVPADANGGGSLRDKLVATEGGIGYMDLATARGGTGAPFTWSNAGDEMFWVPLENRNSHTFEDPQVSTGYVSGDTHHGANCVNATSKAPLPANSFGDWSTVDYTDTAVGYPACTLTYDMAFDDDSVVYCNSASEERKARSVVDFLTKAVVSDAGQNNLPGQDYDKLPADALAEARAAVAQIGWKKDGSGRPCTTTTPPSGGGGGGGGGGTTPPPANVSNAFTLASSRSTSTSIRLSLQFPGAGKVVVSGTAKPKKGKSVKLAAKTVTVGAAGSQAVTISLSSKAKALLKRNKTISVKLTITFTPNGGTARTVSKTVTVKAAKKSKK